MKKKKMVARKALTGAYPAGNTYFNNYITTYILAQWQVLLLTFIYI